MAQAIKSGNRHSLPYQTWGIVQVNQDGKQERIDGAYARVTTLFKATCLDYYKKL